MDNIFQKIIDKQIPAKIAYEDELCLAFHDVQPQSPVHILVVPKKPIRSLAQLTAEDSALMGHMVLKCSQIAAEQGLASDGYRVVINTNKNGGQSVYHLHMHILGGRALSWPPG
jgi:histidine triad (HIT) family protein